MASERYAIYDTPGSRKSKEARGEKDSNKPPITSIHEAAEAGDVEAMSRFAKRRRFDIEARDRYGRTALMWACDVGSLDGVELCLRYGADVNAMEVQTGRTAMHWAARYGDEAIIRALVDEGADIHLPDRGGQTPLYLALQRGHKMGHGAPRLLMELGAKYNNYNYLKLTSEGEEGCSGLTPEEEYQITGVPISAMQAEGAQPHPAEAEEVAEAAEEVDLADKADKKADMADATGGENGAATAADDDTNKENLDRPSPDKASPVLTDADVKLGGSSPPLNGAGSGELEDRSPLRSSSGARASKRVHFTLVS